MVVRGALVLVAPRVPLQLACNMPLALVAYEFLKPPTRCQGGKTGRSRAFPHKIELCDGILFPKSCAKWAKRAARQPEAKAEENAWLRLALKREKSSPGKRRKLGGRKPKEGIKRAAWG